MTVECRAEAGAKTKKKKKLSVSRVDRACEYSLVVPRADIPRAFCETDAGNGGRHCDRADFDRFGQSSIFLFDDIHGRTNNFETWPF